MTDRFSMSLHNSVHNACYVFVLCLLAVHSRTTEACGGLGGHIEVDNQSSQIICVLHADHSHVQTVPFSKYACLNPEYDKGKYLKSHFCFSDFAGDGGYQNIWMIFKDDVHQIYCDKFKIDNGGGAVSIDTNYIEQKCPLLSLSLTRLHDCTEDKNTCQITLTVSDP